jgi:hypothetical protein
MGWWRLDDLLAFTGTNIYKEDNVNEYVETLQTPTLVSARCARFRPIFSQLYGLSGLPPT